MRTLLLVSTLMLTATACTPEEVMWWASQDTDQQQQAAIAIITDAANEYGVDPQLMIAIARCESGLRPWAHNPSGASGLFQHMIQFWPGRAEAIGQPDADVFDPVANARVAAMMMQHGTSPWAPSQHCWRN